MKVRTFELSDTQQVVDLWQRCELTRPWNDPVLDIQRKLAMADSLFLAGVEGDVVIAVLMGGYDGHRGWMNYLCVSPDHQRKGHAAEMIQCLEDKLLALNCPKINLQIRTDNIGVQNFYKTLGYTRDDVVSMGKRLIPDN